MIIRDNGLFFGTPCTCIQAVFDSHSLLADSITANGFSMQNSQHCFNCLLPDTRNIVYVLSLQLVTMFLWQPFPLQIYVV